MTEKENAHSNARFKRTVERISGEAFWLSTYQAAINGMRVEAIGLDFFTVSLNALKDARLIRLIRVLEDDQDTASFWYLVRSNQPLVMKAAKNAELDLTELKEISDRFRGSRNKTFVHIDKFGVFDPQQYYKAAALSNDDVAYVCRKLFETMKYLYMDTFGKELIFDEYDGNDIISLAKLRDDALSA